jgi:hypothetical protein
VILRHATLHDWYVEEADPPRSTVFVGDQVLVLSEMATSILAIVGPDGQASLEEIEARLVEEYGDPGAGAREMVLAKVTELIEQGVLVEA